MDTFFQQFLPAIIFLTTIFFHAAKKNLTIAVMYSIQSIAIVLVLFKSFMETGSLPLLFVIMTLLAIKGIIAPRYFIELIKKHGVKFSSSTYVNLPVTLIIIITLTTITYSRFLLPLTALVPSHSTQLALAIAGMFISLFLMINRKGALSQIIGILSCENNIVVFAIFSGLEQSTTLQIGIIFNLVIWLTIAKLFVSMIYKHFGSLDITEMNQLKD